MAAPEAPDARRDFVTRALARFEQPLLRYAASLVGRLHAPDVVQDTFVALCKAEPGEVEGHLAAWLFRVCKNRALDQRRRSGRLAELENEDDMESPDSGPASRVERAQALDRVERALGSLNEQQRQVVLLKFSAGLKYQEIAEAMQLSASNVGFILHTAVNAIRRELGETEPVLREARSLP